MWRCLCDCGNHTVVLGALLKNGNTKTCGCRGVPLHPSITQLYLIDILDYSPDTGIFTWKTRLWDQTPGGLAGTINADGYVKISINGTSYYGHRLAWIYQNGEWPTKDLDHANRIRSDNRIKNLREAGESLNGFNRPASQDSVSGYKGVSLQKGGHKWRSRISINGKELCIGNFYTPEDAARAYDRFAEENHREFFCPNFQDSD